MRRALALIAVVVGVALWAAAPAQAIETKTFGMEPNPSDTRTSYRIEVRPGATTTEELRVWNKTDAALTLELSAISASVDAAGKVALGGASGVGSWFSFDPEQVQLAPKASEVVRFSVSPPRSLDGSDVAAAVTVEPVATEGGGVAVVQRLATMVYIDTIAGTASGGIDWKIPALIVLSVVSIAGAVAAWTRPRDRTRDDIEERTGDDEYEEDEMEHATRAIDIDDPAIDRLYEAMYEAPTPLAPPKLALVIEERVDDSAMTDDAPMHEADVKLDREEFAWTVSSRR